MFTGEVDPTPIYYGSVANATRGTIPLDVYQNSDFEVAFGWDGPFPNTDEIIVVDAFLGVPAGPAAPIRPLVVVETLVATGQPANTLRLTLSADVPDGSLPLSLFSLDPLGGAPFVSMTRVGPAVWLAVCSAAVPPGTPVNQNDFPAFVADLSDGFLVT